MPPRRQPSTRATAPKTSDAPRTVPIRNPARRTKATAMPDSTGEAVDLAQALDQKLTVESKAEAKTTLMGRRVTRTKGESTPSLPESSQTREQPRALAKPRVVRKSRMKPEVAAQDDSETLADELKAKLTITPKSVEERSLDAMRAINSASKGLSSVIQSGWTVSCDGTISPTPYKASKASLSTLTAVTEHFTSAKHSLQTLRKTKPCNMDTERAASSIVGKLISLEMFDCALEALADMRLSMISLYTHDERTSLYGPDKLRLLTLPHPSSQGLDETLLTLLSTYLLQSMTAIAYTLFRAASKPSQDEIEALCSALHEGEALISWLPNFTSLPSSHLDSVLTRAYTTLAKSTQLFTGTDRMAVAIYRIRVYGILCLAYTSPGVLDPNTFWNQAVKFTTSFVKHAACQSDSNETDEEHATAIICTTFTELVDIAMARPDSATFVGGRGLITFCQYWTSFAKRANDINTMERIRQLMRGAAPATSLTPVPDVSKTLALDTRHGRQRSKGTSRPEPISEQTVEAAQLYTLFAEATCLLEQSIGIKESKCLVETLEAMERSIPHLRRSIARGTDDGGSDDDILRSADKVRRAFERLRRTATKILEELSGRALQDSDSCQQVIAVVKKGVAILEVLQHTTPHHDLLTAALDSLFVLARTSLKTSDPSTFGQAYDHLAQSARLVPTDCRDEDVVPNANFYRCISGAYHNLAATLYQASRYDFAIRFLDQSCTLGERALKMYREASSLLIDEQSEESWSQLEEQLWRRWEILGVCHSKTEDRKNAFQAFLKCVQTFPFHRHNVLELISGSGAMSIFASPQLSHVGEVVDRLTYAGLCDLYMEPKAVSLKGSMTNLFIGRNEANVDQFRRTVVGALLEKQIEGLDKSKWKPDVRKTIDILITESLEVYDARHMPVRRARMILKSLEMAYHKEDGGDETDPASLTRVGDGAVEADQLLIAERLHYDEPLKPFQPYYRAMLKLWLSLLVHRSAQTSSFSRVVAYADEACDILRALTSAEHGNFAAKDSPPHTRGGRKTAAKTQPTLTRTAGRNRARTVKSSAIVAPVTPKRKTTKSVAMHAMKTTPMAQPSLEHAVEYQGFFGMSHLVELLRATAQLLGLLGQVITKVRLLLQARRLCERVAQSRPDDFVKISVDLAHEYVKLGKTEKGGNIYKHTLSVVKNLALSGEARVLFFLRYSESLAITGNVLKSSSVYCEACGLSDDLPDAEKGMSTVQRVVTRSASLERSAIAASTFANIQYFRDEPAVSIDGLLQALRLWSRALDTLTRLVPPAPSSKARDDADNPFLSEEAKTTATNRSNSRTEVPLPSKKYQKPPSLNGLEWRIAEGLLGTLFSLVHAYIARGTPREAEYFAQQAKELAGSLKAPAMASRALARVGEIQLHLGLLDESHASLTEAADLAAHVTGPDAAEIRRLLAEHSRYSADDKEAQQLYAEAMSTLEELDKAFVTLDGANTGPRKSIDVVPQAKHEAMAPEVLIAILRQNIWLLRGEGEAYEALLERFKSITANAETKAEQDALIAKLSLDNVYSRFQADMFLSSLTESTITLPMGRAMETTSLSASRQDTLNVLANAERLFWSDLASVARRGKVFHVRDAAVSLALVRAFQVSLGRNGTDGPILAAGLLDTAAAITLRREMLEVVRFKFPEVDHDDSQWPLITANGSPLPPKKSKSKLRFEFANSEDSDEEALDGVSAKAYWDNIKKKYESYVCDAGNLSQTQQGDFPRNWVVINISVTDDKNTMFVTRQRPRRDPLIVCIPLKGRRENDEEEQLGFSDALVELKEIIRLSDEGTRQACSVRDDREQRAAWWADRIALDKRLKELLENIEFCWLGAFKAILAPPMTIPNDLLDQLRAGLEQVFERSIVLRDKRQKSFVHLDDSLIECFAAIPPKCRDEELEDIVYFILDFYQFHGMPVSSAEVDIDQVVIDVRAVLEEFATKSQGRLVTETDPHMFLVLDKNVQSIPWESIPALRGHSVSRIPSMDFLVDRLQYVKMHQSSASSSGPIDRIHVDPHKVFYVLNPSGDLKNTEGRFVGWLKGMKKVGWSGVTGRAPSEQQLVDALGRKDLVLYFGHGGAEQYIRSRKVRHLPRCAATMLWGCSSGALKEMGDFDRTGTPYNYMLAGCPTLVANLWDVTDRDIDKFAQSVFDKMGMDADKVRNWCEENMVSGTSVVSAVSQSRESCKLKYLTGAAPVLYGIPFYL